MKSSSCSGCTKTVLVNKLTEIRSEIEKAKDAYAKTLVTHDQRYTLSDKDYYRKNGEICGLLEAMIIIDKELMKLESSK